MTREEFEAAATADGFDLREVELAPHTEREVHTHPFEARLFILDGIFTLAVGAERRVFRPGEICGLGANIPHQEITGAEGARYVAGRRGTGAA